MKKFLLSFTLLSLIGANALGEQVTLNDKAYDINTIIDRDLGPGVRYTRIRIPDYPLNVNMLRIDVSNPYNSVETTQASDRLYGTESLVKAAQRQTSEGHVALGGANANFWCVSGQPPFSDQLIGLTYNGNLKNDKIITETNMHSDQWNGGWKHTGIVGITPEGTAWSGHGKFGAWAYRADGTELTVHCFNKTVREDQLTAYNSYYGTDRTFRCVDQGEGADGKQHFTVIDGCATEVYLTLDPDQKWSAGENIVFTVREIKQNSGGGKVGSDDLVLVGRGASKTELDKLTVGEKVKLRYTWTDGEDRPITFDNLVGGNAQVMIAGELTKYNTSETYNSQVYSRTGYGVSQDGKTLYIVVIDKSTDPVYGRSAGCSTTVMCAIAKHYGCWDMTNFDAGGSAEMLVENAIINKTTEGSPRSVANGMIVYSTAPVDNNITRLEFADYRLQAPIYGTYKPVIYGFNQYGALIDHDVQGVTLSCPAEAGTCDGATFSASKNPGTYALTATLGEVTVSKDIEVCEAQIAIRLKEILLDHQRAYEAEVGADVQGHDFSIAPSSIKWSIGDADIASVDDQGVVRGIKNGTTTLTAVIGDYSDEAKVTVEIPETRYMPMVTAEVADWTSAGTGTKNRSIVRAGEYGVAATYTVSSTRNTSLTVRPKTPSVLYSLPDSVRLVINPGDAKISKAILKLGHNGDRHDGVTYELELTPEADNILEAAVSDFVDTSNLANYPLAFTSIQLTLGDANASTHTITLPRLEAVYDSVKSTQGIDAITTESATDAPAALYNLQGVRISENTVTPGIYIRVRGGKATKILVK